MGSRSRRSSAPGPRLAAGATLAAALAVATGTSYAHPGHSDTDPLLGDSTLEHTIRGEDQERVNDGRGAPDSFALLRLGPGEPYVVREALGRARGGRDQRRRSLIYVGHLTDFQIADQQSPARVEFLDPQGGAVSSAWRPQETLVPHQTELTIRQVNRFLRSPVPQGNGNRARMANAVMTGDLADNQQLNETRWVAQLLQGGVFIDGTRVGREVDPNSGSSDVTEYPPECQAAVALNEADPELGLNPEDADRYVGVQNHDDYPGGSTLADKNNFYDPNDPSGLYENWPVYEGLMDKAQEPFVAQGLRVPSYVAFGNHDMLAQGNQWSNASFDRIARGCVKVFPAPGAEAFLEEILGQPIGLRHPRLMREALEIAEQPSAQQAPVLESFEQFVPPDDDRRFVDRREFKQIFDNGFQDDAHGFGFIDADELEASDGAASYYDFSPAEGIRYIVLDTVSYGGQFPLSSSGNISHPQFLWLRRKLRQAQRRNELIMVFGHHAIGSLTSPVPHENAPPCRDPVTGEDQQDEVGPGCDRDPRDSRKPGEPSPHQGEDLEELLLQFPNVVALVAGHSHENQIQPFRDGEGGGFWEIKSPAIVDWPAQHRVIELMDNRDGTLSIFTTMLDDASPPRSPTPDGDGDQGNSPRFVFEEEDVEAFTTEDLASVGRTLSYNDPQVGPQSTGEEEEQGRPQGVEIDRNTELLLGDPREPEPEPEPDRPPDRDRDRDRPEGEPDRGVAADAERDLTTETADRRGALPFTGLAVLLLLLIAAALLAGGRLARHLSRGR